MILVFFMVKLPKMFRKTKEIDAQPQLSKGELCQQNTKVVLAYFRSQDDEEKQMLKELNRNMLKTLVN